MWMLHPWLKLCIMVLPVMSNGRDSTFDQKMM
jgi:hypothetical protein